MKKRILLGLLLAIILLLIAVPVLAIDDPDGISISGVWVYKNCRQTGDQLYIVDYTLDYSVTGNPVETVTEAFICRLMDGAAELRGVAPYAYYNDGYDRGVVAIYFDSSTAPPWEGDYTMELVGNPLLDWDADPPSASVSTFNVWQDNDVSVTQTVVSSRILYLADILELAWSVDMIEATGGGHTLTSYGEDYFTNVVPYASEIAPYAFSGQTILPDVDEVSTSTDYADQLENMILGTPFDLTNLAADLATTRGALTAILYYGAVLYFLLKMSEKFHSHRVMALLGIVCVIGGAFVGVPLIITILAGFLALGYVAWSLLYKPSPA